ncbi:hypothetical protein [Keratinibaculum paraultunense]|uniref:hypothetical protein n=1 Tax=Keratinibaculum paraultunense TaxID=1278232 RepID=UPI00105349D9|nr:hypothetical protein [Keratinibaculum paraultunense]QQY79469.1 hypothetical protein JL105_09790 [Keratinibaculum paraultunense]
MDILYNTEGKEIGKVGGILLNNSSIEKIEKEELVENFIQGINKIKPQNVEDLIIEDISLFSREDIKLIEARTNLKVVDGINTLYMFLPLVLEEIQKYLKEDFRRKEILIIGEGDTLTEELVYALHKSVSFISIAGEDKEAIENISQSIFKKTGLSIFYTQNIDKILINYPIIVNLKDDVLTYLNKFRRGSIIFDFSISKKLSRSIKDKKNLVVIEDFMFFQELDMMENPWIQEWVSSKFYDYFKWSTDNKQIRFLVDSNICTMEELINRRIRQKGTL